LAFHLDVPPSCGPQPRRHGDAGGHCTGLLNGPPARRQARDDERPVVRVLHVLLGVPDMGVVSHQFRGDLRLSALLRRRVSVRPAVGPTALPVAGFAAQRAL